MIALSFFKIQANSPMAYRQIDSVDPLQNLVSLLFNFRKTIFLNFRPSNSPEYPAIASQTAQTMNANFDYKLEAPTWEKAVEAYAKLLGEEQATEFWAEACRFCNVYMETGELAELETVFLYLSQKDGITGVYGTSLLLRLKTYCTLANAQIS